MALSDDLLTEYNLRDSCTVSADDVYQRVDSLALSFYVLLSLCTPLLEQI